MVVYFELLFEGEFDGKMIFEVRILKNRLEGSGYEYNFVYLPEEFNGYFINRMMRGISV